MDTRDLKYIKTLTKFNKIGKRLGSGAFGYVYEFGNKVIKISEIDNTLKKDLNILARFHNHKYDCISKLYDYGMERYNVKT